MSRKDTIIIAVLINTGLLAVLFMMAVHTETPETMITEEATVEIIQSEPVPVVEARPVQTSHKPQKSYIASRDEIDEVLKNYSMSNKQTVVVSPEASPKKITKQNSPAKANKNIVEITVKRGDYLEKIARANGTTVGAIMLANNLSSARIDIGQVLLVPIDSKPVIAPKNPVLNKRPELASSERQYYTIKSGDNPWKIAKEFDVRFGDLLKMNDLDEEKARKLKPGDVLRVK